jgi:ADP-dependent NAD(P)H-hydrate dehydratase / NAD(P)H-hydrate epimerase
MVAVYTQQHCVLGRALPLLQDAQLQWQGVDMADPEILTPEQMYAADALAVAHGLSSLKLMEAAGQAVVDEIIKRFEKCPVAVLCGPGNNGGDGFVVARLLAALKWPVKVYLIGEKDVLKGDAAKMAAKWKGAIQDFQAFEQNHGGKQAHRLIVDAIYGAGLNRDMAGAIADGIHGAGRPVVAIDVPSGVDGNTGQVRGAAVIARLTVTFVRKKPGHLLYPGRRFCGEVVVSDIGIGSDIIDLLPIRIHENLKPDLPELLDETHKFKRGHVLVWSGPALASGASRLSAQAAARVGTGLITLAGSRDALMVHAHHVTSIMLKEVATPHELADFLKERKVTAACIGPAAGVNEVTRRATLCILKSGVDTVLDADALTVFADEPDQLFEAIKAQPDRAVVMTPHEGEFARLFNDLTSNSDSKVERTIKAAERSGARVVLKGPDTVIANPNGFARINAHAPAKLATAGSGDVLSGIITGLLAQGMDAWNAASAGVWLHGEAALSNPRRTIIAEDLIDRLAL